MKALLLEVRDRSTFIPVVAVLMDSTDPAEAYLLRRAGFDPQGEPSERFVMLARLESGFCTYDPFGWPGPARTMREAHLAIRRRWSTLKSGDVIDVEYERGESAAPKKSERFAHAFASMEAASVYAGTPPTSLPSLEEPASGDVCQRCGQPRRLVDFCAECFERED